MKKEEFIQKIAGYVKKYAAAYEIKVMQSHHCTGNFGVRLGRIQAGERLSQLFWVEMWDEMAGEVRQSGNLGGIRSRNGNRDFRLFPGV